MRIEQKFLMILGLTFAVSNAFADCGATDKFHFEGVPSATIQALISSDPRSLVATKTDPRSFKLHIKNDGAPRLSSCKPYSTNASVTVGFDANNYCTLSMRDGPFMQDPIIENADCKGKMSFVGLTYDGF